MPPIPDSKMKHYRFWRKDEKVLLLELLDKASYQINVSDHMVMRGVVQAMVTTLTKFGCPNLTKGDVVKKIQELRDRFVNFVWFLCTPKIMYDVRQNHIIPKSDYNAEKESHMARMFRLMGEPRYHVLDRLFRTLRMDTLDFAWLLMAVEYPDYDIHWVVGPVRSPRAFWGRGWSVGGGGLPRGPP